MPGHALAMSCVLVHQLCLQADAHRRIRLLKRTSLGCDRVQRVALTQGVRPDAKAGGD